jgi:predicted transcriptional regulator
VDKKQEVGELELVVLGRIGPEGATASELRSMGVINEGVGRTMRKLANKGLLERQGRLLYKMTAEGQAVLAAQARRREVWRQWRERSGWGEQEKEDKVLTSEPSGV